MDISVIDNAIPSELLNNYNKINIEWSRNRSDDGESTYSTCHEYGMLYEESKAHTIQDSTKKWKHKEAEDIWKWFANKTNISLDNLNSCYTNSLVYGDEGYTHIDAEPHYKEITVIIYLNEIWHSQWGGETVFYSDGYTPDFSDAWYYNHEIVKSVLPRFNRMTVFDGSTPHSVRCLSRRCFLPRNTLMFKLVNTNFDKIKKGLIDATT